MVDLDAFTICFGVMLFSRLYFSCFSLLRLVSSMVLCMESVTLSARTGFAVAVFAAAAALVLAWHSEAQAVEAQAVAYGAMGIEW